MAAECPLAERRFVEIKMGRSKFPGKPSKIGNRKRVNLSSCALPEDNESSKAAENIYLGLSMFNETFGDNEMMPHGPFHGFSAEDVEEAMAEARLQQRESEIEHRKQGLNMNVLYNFQSEYASIMDCFSLNGNHDKNKTRLCFDGGGDKTNNESLVSVETSECKSSNTFVNESTCNAITFNVNFKLSSNNNNNNNSNNSTKKYLCKKIRTINSTSNVLKLPRKLNSFKSLQSRAAKKLLDKAKMSNISEMNKNNINERKFILPSYSMHSLRVIKPNKRFLEDNVNNDVQLSRACIDSRALKNKLSKEPKINSSISFNKELRIEITDDIRKRAEKSESVQDGKMNYVKEQTDKLKVSHSANSSKANVHYTSTGKLILREPKLQLNRLNLGLTEGPFSSSSHSSSLSPNSQLNPSSVHLSMHSTVTCGVCGSVKFYKFVELSKKFGIYCCEPCQKFISKIIKLVESGKHHKLLCSKGKGLCPFPIHIKSQHMPPLTVECEACWLKLCLKNFKMPNVLKKKLSELLPGDMQLNKNLDTSSDLSKEDVNAFVAGSDNVKDFGWLNEVYEKSTDGEVGKRSRLEDRDTENKDINLLNSLAHVRDESLRKLNGSMRMENKRKLMRHRGKVRTFNINNSRQRIDLKGPRVKNVCRSASIVLGQPIATFPREPGTKKQTSYPSIDTSKYCDKSETTNNSCIESQGILLVDKGKDSIVSDKKQLAIEKKSNVGCKQITNIKPSPAQPNVGKTRRRLTVKTENPISIDFWETYDPEEICENGFGLIGYEDFSVRALCYLCGSSGHEKLIHCASCCEPYHEFCLDEEQVKHQDSVWKYDWVCPRCTVCVTCGKTSGQQLKCVKCDNSYHIECVDRVGGRLLHSPDRPWVCSNCLRCKSCNGVDVSVFVGNLPLCRACFVLRQKGNYCPLCQRCYEDDDYDSKMMECGQCKCWVHAKCEGLSDEKYQVLSFLPESVEYICRMCCVMPPAPWWIAVEAELKSGYLGVLKALSKNRKACAMLKWSPRKQCTCRQVSFTPRALNFEEVKLSKTDDPNPKSAEKEPVPDDKVKEENCKPAPVLERKTTNVEVVNHSTGSLKLTLKIMKGADSNEKSDIGPLDSETVDNSTKLKDICEKFSIKECSVRVKKCPFNEEIDSLSNSVNCIEDSQLSPFKSTDFSGCSSELPDKRSLSSPLNPSSDSGIGSTDDELKVCSLTDEESGRPDDQQSNRTVDSKSIMETSVPLLEDKNECICFLEVDSYNSRSKPFSPNLLSIKKKVTTSEYSSLQQFHMDMQRMIATTQSNELMEMYYQTVKEIFPWFDPKFSRVFTNSQKISGTASLESTPVKSTPTKSIPLEECSVPKDKLIGQPLEYYYGGLSIEDNRACLMCKEIGDGAPNNTGRLLYCGQNEWVHCNCALWSAEVFEEIDGSLQNVHSAISRGRSIRCPECNVKGASIGCCARNCSETFHFTCARKIGCAFMDDKTVYCPAHINETKGKIVQNEKEFEIRRPIYVELDKKKMKMVDSSQVRLAVGGLLVKNLGRFAVNFSDYPDAIVPDQFQCTRLFWSCYEPWRMVKYHFTVRFQENEENEGIDSGINLTIDHSKEPELLDLKLKQLKYFQEHNKLLDIGEEKFSGPEKKEKRRIIDNRSHGESRIKSDDLKHIPAKRSKKDNKIVKKIVDLFDSRDDESCLSDSQNTADLIPPELEEAIFKDLPNDILDGISMQDIFMDIKADVYENTDKDMKDGYDTLEIDEAANERNETSKMKKIDVTGEINTQNESWQVTDDSKHNIYDWTDETCSKLNRDLKRSRSDVLPSRRNMTLKNNQRSCSLNWNCKMDIHTTKRKRNPKCHTTLNSLEPQERGNMLQELKFTDGLVMVSTESLASVRDMKDRLAIQQEEGKENKCLPWHMKLQPRLLQVDGGVDSSSSGSEAGESPQRLTEENVITSRGTDPSQPSHFSSKPSYSGVQYAPSSETYTQSFNLPQIDGLDDGSSDDSDLEYFQPVKMRSITDYYINFKITQLDGSADSESEGKNNEHDSIDLLLDDAAVKEEPVKCNQCLCTYRTKISYERHLENCCNDYILFSSDGEGSDEENSLHPKNIDNDENLNENNSKKSAVLSEANNCMESPPKANAQPNKSNSIQTGTAKESTPVKLEVKKEKIKRAQVRRKAVPNTIKKPVIASQNVQQILVQQNTVPPAVIVPDLTQANIVSGTFIDPGTTIQYVASLESQAPFSKPHLLPTANTVMPGGFHIQTPESHLISSLPVISQNMHTNLPGIIIQQPQVAGALISSQPTPMVMPGDQMMLGAAPLLEVIHDPQTGGMFLASHNQPVFYNMETIVSNTVMQTNQYVSNVMTTSSFSQTSTQVVQTSKLEQVMNVPSNIILVGQSSSDKLMSSADIICLPAAQPLIQNPSPIQAVVNPIIQTSQTFNSEPKIIPAQINPSLRCIQPVQALPQPKRFCSPIVNKVTSMQSISRTSEVRPNIGTVQCNKNLIQAKHNNNSFRSMPMMRPNVTKSPPRQYEKAVIIPKSQKSSSKAIVDYINNFKSESCDIPSSTTLNSKTENLLKKEKCLQTSHLVTTTNKRTEETNKFNDSPSVIGEHTPEPSSTAPNSITSDSTNEIQAIPAAVEDVTVTISSPISSSATATATNVSTTTTPTIPPFTTTTAANTALNAPHITTPVITTTTTNTITPSFTPTTATTPVIPTNTVVASSIEKIEANGREISENNGKKESPASENVIIQNAAEISPKEAEFNKRENESALETRDQKTKVKENLSKSDAPNVLPLQETSPPVNNTPNVMSRTVAKPVKLKEKTQLFTTNQNCVATKLVTIHPRLIQSPGTEDEPEAENRKKVYLNGKSDDKGPRLIFDVTSDDGFSSSSTSMSELWAKICDSVQEMRAVFKIPPLPISRKGHEILGMQNHGLQHCLEQLRGVEQCVKYKCKYFVKEKSQKSLDDRLAPVKENLSGCARTEPFGDRKEYDMFAWLASGHRRLPKLCETSEEVLSSARRANSLPMAMRYRHLRETAKTYVGVYRSKIHGKGLFCLREIEAGEMVIEYAGEVIRSNITDKREKYYTEKGIGCYMFRIDDHFVVDATMKGNAARFINHSCEPNCYSRVVDILGKKHIVIFALRRIHIMEELTYDYKFPFEDEKISCHCLSKKCRKYLN